MDAARSVQSEGFDVRAIRPPTVPPGTCRLRVVVHADHESAELDALARALLAAVPSRELGLASLRANPQNHYEPAPTPSPVASRAPAVVVAGTDTGVGKTVVSALLLRHLRRQGTEARYFKPVQTGTDSDTSAALELSASPAEVAPPPAVQLALPASVDQAAAAEGVEVRARELARAVEAHLADDPATRWVLECAGGLLVPLNTRETQADVLCALNLPLVLVARSGLGTLNHTLLTLEEAARRGLRVRALFLVGPRHTANAATLRARLELPIVEREWLEPLTPDALDAWLDANPLERDAWTT